MKSKIMSVALSLSVFSAVAAGFVACGKDNEGVEGAQEAQAAPSSSPSPEPSPEPSPSPLHNPNLKDAVGLYEAGENLKTKSNGQVEFFIVTPQSALYTLPNNGNESHFRDYKGSLAKGVIYTLDDTAFSSGDIEGHKFHDTTLTNVSNDIKILARVNEKAHHLQALLESAGLVVEVQLGNDKISFIEEQEKFIEEFLINGKYRMMLVQFMQSRKLKGIRINDYTNNYLYTKDGLLCVPKGSGYLSNYNSELEEIFKDTLTLPKI